VLWSVTAANWVVRRETIQFAVAMTSYSAPNSLETRRYAQRAQTSADPEDPDFGLWTPGSEA